MPGIVGLITKKPREEAERELHRMIAVMCHETFYVANTWTDDSLGIYAGSVARKGSFAEGMPLQSERGDVVLAFSGEEFPGPATKSQLLERGHAFKKAGPAYLVHLAEEQRNFLAGLNGRFHGLLVDRRHESAMLFNDRYGMERLYYHEAKDTFYFAAEAKAILAVLPELRRLNSQSLGEFISCGAVLDNRTLFEGISILPPASTWTFSNKSLQKKGVYFLPKEWEDQEALGEKEFYQEFRKVFKENLPRYFINNEPLAMSLTGGLDTRMIMAWQRSEPGSLPCYTFGSMFRENCDVKIAKRVAKACRQPFQEITAGEEFLSHFTHYAERAVYLTDGCIDLSRSPDLYINEKARQIAPVRMTGNYGGEVLRRVRTFKPSKPLARLYSPEIVSCVDQASETFTNLASGHPVSFAVFKQCPWNHYGVLALEQSQLALRSPFLDNDLVKTVFRAPMSVLSGNEASLQLIADGNPDLLRIPTDRGLLGDRGRLTQAAHHSFHEFQFKAEYAYDMGMPQWLSRVDNAISSLHLERLFLGRHKVFHFRVWYRDVLANYVREILLDPRSLSRPYIERRSLVAIVNGHLKGVRNYTQEIHKLLAIEILQRQLLENPLLGAHSRLPRTAAPMKAVG